MAKVEDFHPYNYSKMEKAEREFSIEVIDKLAKFFGLCIDDLVQMTGNMPKAATAEDKITKEKLQMISQLGEEHRDAVIRIIDGMLTNK
jgi:hypothetical protein